MSTQNQNKPIAKVIQDAKSETMKRQQEARRKAEDIKINREMSIDDFGKVWGEL